MLETKPIWLYAILFILIALAVLAAMNLWAVDFAFSLITYGLLGTIAAYSILTSIPFVTLFVANYSVSLLFLLCQHRLMAHREFWKIVLPAAILSSALIITRVMMTVNADAANPTVVTYLSAAAILIPVLAVMWLMLLFCGWLAKKLLPSAKA